jgi:phenylacetate-coenzyme A ligase PaaK-like adenylate-forming protein
MTYSCREGWLHVNSDWVVLEPVDQDYQPASPGQESHTILISNLANRVQPILRYDIGDRAVQRPDPCPCGNPLPAIQVQGRASEVLYVPNGQGNLVGVPPGVFTDVGHIPGLDVFQIEQVAPATLCFRFRTRAGADAQQVWRSVESESRRILAEHKLENVTFERSEEPPYFTPGGKLPRVLPLRE